MANLQSDGVAEDLIRSIVQIGCAEVHTKTLLEKAEGQLENGYIDAEDADQVTAQLNKIADLTAELNSLAELRRSVMLHLFQMFDGDKDYWCLIKHLGVGAYTLFEAYQASDDDPTLYTLFLEANKRFTKALTHFLGVEITECAACLADALSAANKS